MIIYRYLRKEVVYAMFTITVFIVVVFTCNEFIRFLRYVAGGKYDANLLTHLVLLQMPTLFGFFLSLGLFIAILLVYGRLHVDYEMVVMRSCGLSYAKIILMTTRIAIGVAFIVALLVFFVNPGLMTLRFKLLDYASARSVFQTITPGNFIESSDGKSVFYIKKFLSHSKIFGELFMASEIDDASKKHAASWVILTAKQAEQQIDVTTGEHFLFMKDGFRYQGVPGQKDYQMIHFGTYRQHVDNPITPYYETKEQLIPTEKLIKMAQKGKNYAAELQWRISMPISVIILAWIAVPLSKVNPRQGRFVKLIPAILFYIIYANMIFASRTWMETGVMPTWIGMWWVHIIALLFACLLNFIHSENY